MGVDMKKIEMIIGFVLAFCISMASLTAQQQEPLPPKNFHAIVEETSAGPAVKITWTANDEGVTPNVFTIYSTFGDQEKLIMNAQIKYEPNKLDYVFYVHNLAGGVYNFFMRAGLYVNGRIVESEKTETITLTIEKTNTVFQFVSEPPTSAVVGGKYVYGMKVHSSYNCKIGYELVSSPEGMYIDGNNIFWAPTAIGEYKVSVKAFLIECDHKAETYQSFVIRVTDGNNGQLYVRIIMENNGIKMNLGEAITYKMKYETNANCPVLFEFQGEIPEGFHFDSKGTFTFKPTHEGTYQLTVKAYLECHPEVHHLMPLVIIVGEGHQEPPKHCAYIKGAVSDEDNNPVNEGVVSAWKLDRPNSNTKEMTLFKSEIKDGQYSINVPEGNYALDISGKTFYPEWYQDAEFVTDAERITVKCEDVIEINAIVKLLPVPKTYTVTGKVYDAESNNPVLAQIEFIPVQNVFEDSRNKEGHSFVTKTDENGNYSIQLKDNYDYIARAVSMMNSIKYNVVYYESANNPMEADIIQLTGDLADINFALKKSDGEAKGGFAGKVVNKDGQPLLSKVIAYCIKTKNQYFAKVNTTFTTETDEEGNFRFAELIPGDYVILSVPLNRDYVPGYYKQNDFAVLKWKDGTIITVGEAMVEMIFEVKHRNRGEIGLVKIDGKIVNAGGGVIEGKSEKSQSNVPVAGALVYVIDANGMVSDYGYSNSNGEFNLKEVAVGNLRLIADKVGFEAYENNLQSDFEKNSSIQMEIGMNEAVVNVKDNTLNLFDAVLYPSPTDKSITLKFTSLKQQQAEIAIVNLLGLDVYKVNFEAVRGENVNILRTSELIQGTYFIRLTVGNVTQTLPLVISR
jgi:hypothetical protein